MRFNSPYKVHLFHDWEGATYANGTREYNNTLCKGNHSAVRTTKNMHEVTCKRCLRAINDAASSPKGRIPYLQFVGLLSELGFDTPRKRGCFIRAVRAAGALDFPDEVESEAPEPRHPRLRYRKDWRGRLIVQIEKKVPINPDPQYAAKEYALRWVDATEKDMEQPL